MVEIEALRLTSGGGGSGGGDGGRERKGERVEEVIDRWNKRILEEKISSI